MIICSLQQDTGIKLNFQYKLGRKKSCLAFLHYKKGLPQGKDNPSIKTIFSSASQRLRSEQFVETYQRIADSQQYKFSLRI